MSSEPPGTSTSEVEVVNVSRHEIWLLAGQREFLLPYEDFLCFKDVPIGKIINVEQHTPGHFYWPDLDVDLGLESIEHPERFPLKAQLTSNPSLERTR
jgi:hypothetical protein